MITLDQKLSLPIRMRRNRKSQAVRSMLRETKLLPEDFIAPFFLLEGEKTQRLIPSMPPIKKLSVDLVIEQAKRLFSQGVQAIALFPVIEKDKKCPIGKEALNPDNLLLQAIQRIKSALPEMCVIADVALDPYTSHGHDGIFNDKNQIDNDASVELLSQMALLQAEAGADFIAPSDMMDGRIAAIRGALDKNKFIDTGILAYSAKYASNLYGPFRDALGSQLAFCDKKTYQMDPANGKEALLEAALDEEEGADILMVKPAGLYLDIIAKIKEQTKRPLAAYHVSGEYAMVMAAHEKGWLHGPKVFFETLLSIKRAGADLIFSYALEQILPYL